MALGPWRSRTRRARDTYWKQRAAAMTPTDAWAGEIKQVLL